MKHTENQVVAARLELLRLEGDNVLERLLWVMGGISLLIGAIYQTLMMSILLSLGLGLIFFTIKYALRRTFFTRQLLVFFWGLHVAGFIMEAHGKPEMRSVFYVLVPVLVVYLDPRVIYYAVASGVAYLNTGYYLLVTGQLAPEYFYNAKPDLQFLVIQNLVMIASGLACGILARRLLRMTQENLARQIEEEQQQVFRAKNIEFASRITAGELEAHLETSEKDPVGEALLRMRTSLLEAERKDQQDKFINQGLTQMAGILRHTADIPTLSYEIVSHLVSYLQANQGGLFILEMAEKDPHLQLVASYAYERRKYTKKRVEIGEGLVGQVVQEGDTLFLTDIPSDYVHITSGLGKANPTCLLIVPLKYNDKIEGVLELATFEPFAPFEVLFVEKVAEIIASTLSVTRTNSQTRALLEELKIQTEILRSQEEEMRQNMEELTATQEEMERRQKELKQEQQKEIDQYKKLLRELQER